MIDPRGAPSARASPTRGKRRPARTERSMPTASVSASPTVSRRKQPPKAPLALLDLTKPGELSAHNFLRRAASGPSPLFYILAIRRRGEALLVAMESAQGSAFVLTLSLVDESMSLRQCRSHEEARASLGSSRPSVDEFASLLRSRRERAGLSREELAGMARLSLGTLRNLETGRVSSPQRETLRGLLRVQALRLVPSELPMARRYGGSVPASGSKKSDPIGHFFRSKPQPGPAPTG